MLKKELLVKLDNLEKELDDYRGSLEHHQKLLDDREVSLEIADGRIEDMKIDRAYLEGMLAVYKRVTNTFQEEYPTHQEAKEDRREIISGIPELPF